MGRWLPRWEAPRSPLTVPPAERQQDRPPDHRPGEHLHQGGPCPEECGQGPHGAAEQAEPPAGDAGPVSAGWALHGVLVEDPGGLPRLLGVGRRARVLKHQALSPSGGSRSSRRSQNSPLCCIPAAASLPASTTPCRPARASQGRPPTASPPAPPRLAAAQLPMSQQVQVRELPGGSSGLWCPGPSREPAGFKGGKDRRWEMRPPEGPFQAA